jgi:hypothetical protein
MRAKPTLLCCRGLLLPARLQALLKVERQVVGWFEIDPAHRQDFAPDRFPVFLLQDEHGYIYGFPGDQHGFKFGKYHHLRQVSTADDVQRSVTPEDEETLRGYLRRYFPRELPGCRPGGPRRCVCPAQQHMCSQWLAATAARQRHSGLM